MTSPLHLILFIAMAIVIFVLLATLSVAGSGFWDSDRREERARRREERRALDRTRVR